MLKYLYGIFPFYIMYKWKQILSSNAPIKESWIIMGALIEKNIWLYRDQTPATRIHTDRSHELFLLLTD